MSKKKRQLPKSVEEVRAYVREKELSVDPDWFWKYFTEHGWIKSNLEPVLSWKHTCWTWHRFSEQRGKKRVCCRRGCNGYGAYTGKDDTNQVYFLCIDHRPPTPEPFISKETAISVTKPVPGEIDSNLARTRNRLKLEIAERTGRRRR
jgi:hypothetical protein